MIPDPRGAFPLLSLAQECMGHAETAASKLDQQPGNQEIPETTVTSRHRSMRIRASSGLGSASLPLPELYESCTNPKATGGAKP